METWKRGKPEKTLRNEAIEDLRTFDSEKWTFGKLSEVFDIPRQYIWRIFKRKK